MGLSASLLALCPTAWAAAQQTTDKTTAPTASPSADSKPIISDAEFDAALPALTPPAQAPLATGTVKPETLPTQDATTPAPTEPDALPAIAAGDNKELDAPLPALAGFDVLPNAAIAPEEPQPQISYAVVVDGLREVGLNDEFKPLSALQAGKGKAVNTAMVRARASEDEALILRLLQSRGYYDGTVSTAITTPSTGNAEARLTVVPGPLYHFGDVRIDAQPTLPSDLIRKALPIQSGDAIVATQVLAAEANVSVVMQQTGYPFAKIGPRDILLDPAKDTGDYTLKVDTGNRSRFAGFRSDGKQAFGDAHIGELTRFTREDLYDNRKVDDLREALVATGLFRSVAVEPVATGQFAADGSEYVDLLVHQQKGPARTLAAEIGYSTGEGFTATASWQNRNRFPPEGALIVTSAIGTEQQGLTTTFRRSNAGRRDRTFQMSAGATHNIYDSYEAYALNLSASISRVSTPLWQKVWTWSYGGELSVTREALGSFSKGANNASNYYIADFPMKIGYDRSDSLLNPATGFRLAEEVTPQVALSGGGSSIRSIADASYYHPVGARAVIAARARYGMVFGGTLANIAPSRRLYAGGGGSVRGYSYQQLGPKDASGNATGGLSLVEASVEYRYRIGDLGIVPFVDVGQSYASTTPTLSDLRVGVGIGARLYTNFGPIRVDVATPISRRTGEPLIALYVGIGQAF